LRLPSSFLIFRVDIAIVDGNLSEGARGCADGKAIAQAIRSHCSGVKIIAYSNATAAQANYGDVYVSKVESIKVLLQAIDTL
jgi:hypothetical protein